jgi:hypothetical protein
MQTMQTMQTMLRNDCLNLLSKEAMGDLVALLGVKRFPMCIQCTTLAWRALDHALINSMRSSSCQLESFTDWNGLTGCLLFSRRYIKGLASFTRLIKDLIASSGVLGSLSFSCGLAAVPM